ncbi:hypothetical protein [Nonomuraea longicatena]|uniref:Integral membrane protein n=1 Tax=Nonomuraea longicatena TaxID=83682 RepID=A0ABP4A6R9_9ACTN
MTQVATRPSAFLLVGVIADGAFKAVLGAAFIVGAAWIGELLGVAAWLMVVAGAVLVITGTIEMGYVRRRPMSTYLRLMIAYDGGWVLTALAGVLLAWRGNGAGGEMWIGYQSIAPIAFTALLLTGTRRAHADLEDADHF